MLAHCEDENLETEAVHEPQLTFSLNPSPPAAVVQSTTEVYENLPVSPDGSRQSLEDSGIVA
jgi:hypothetical protein